MKPLINPGFSTPIFQQIKNLILCQVASGELDAHAQLPSEREYQALLGASRQTVRRALDELVLQGVLFRVPGKGTYVSESPARPPLAAVTATISLLAFSIEHSITTSELSRIVCPDFARDLLTLPVATEVLLLEQVTAVRGELRYIHRAYIPQEIGTPLIGAKISGRQALEMLINICGQRPALSRDFMHPALCSERDATMLGIDPNSAVQVQRGVLLSSARIPLEAHELVIRGDRFKQHLEFRFNDAVLEQFRRLSKISSQK